MLLYLARHAQTASSAVDSFNGRRELPLTERGEEQARLLGLRLAQVRFTAVVCSPLSRTQQTARLAVPRLDPEIEPGLIEVDYGAWEGLSPEAARDLDPAHFAEWQSHPDRVAPPGGETMGQVAERALAALEAIRRRHEPQGGPVIAFSHKATLRVLCCALVGAPVGNYRTRIPQDECALNLVELREGKPPFLRLWNDTSHVGADPAANTRGGH